MKNYYEQIGKNIREVRLSLGFSQKKLADLCEKSNTIISAYENSKKYPSLETIANIAKALNVSIERLYYGDENISFINAVPDEGRKIVNSIYELWKLGVIRYSDNILSTNIFAEPSFGNKYEHDKTGFFLDIIKYPMPIKRLIIGLNEYHHNKKTYDNPDAYLEILLSSVANEINQQI